MGFEAGSPLVEKLPLDRIVNKSDEDNSNVKEYAEKSSVRQQLTTMFVVEEENIVVLANKNGLADVSQKAEKQLIRRKGVIERKSITLEVGTKVITFQLVWSRKNVQACRDTCKSQDRI